MTKNISWFNSTQKKNTPEVQGAAELVLNQIGHVSHHGYDAKCHDTNSADYVSVIVGVCDDLHNITERCRGSAWN